MYHRTDFKNGLKVVSYSMPKMSSVALGIWFKVGARYENKKNKGIAHFLEHMAFKGSRKYSMRQIKESLEGVGGSLNAFTGEEFTCYLVKLPAQYLWRAMDILSDMSLNPRLPVQEIEKERRVIMEEIKMYKDMPQSYVLELLDALLWPEHPMGMSIVGNIETVANIKREDLLGFKDSFYTAQNVVIAACGNLKHNIFVQQVKKIFAKLKPKGENRFLPVKNTKEKPKLRLVEKKIEQTHLAIGFSALPRSHPDRYVLALLHVILGANMSSRLFHEVREKRGLAYEIGTNLKFFYDTGEFLIHAGMDKQKASLALEVILRELKRIKRCGVSKLELKRAKEFYSGQLLLALEDTLDHMLYIGELVAGLNKIYTRAKVLKDIQKVSAMDIQRLAAQLFKINKLNVALVSPPGVKEKEIRDSFAILE